jgi:hypothetical protein
MDQSQQKARELDLVVEKAWPIGDNLGGLRGVVVTRLFVECKFVPGWGVFWFTDKNLVAAEKLVLSYGSFFRHGNTNTNKHHYLSTSSRVAKVFASSRGGAQESDPFYKAVNQVLNALVSLEARPLVAVSGDRAPKVLAILNFPVVVCSSFDKIYAADFDGTLEPFQVKENFQLDVEYAYFDRFGRSRDELFLIDFVEYNRLAQLAQWVQEDVEVAGFF